ncbi:MAG TPA: DNA primase [Gemmatimonadaceae bacterium]|nr:DNA primase [Gemmatimonadaceae bacterium]
MITDDTIERVREAADIVQIIGEHVSLKRTGTDYRGPCPFHQGTHRNFAVVPKKGIYHCFVCHEQGDVFDFLQKRLGMDWPSALRYVAERSGIEVREVQTRRGEPDEREPFWEVNASAAEYFRKQLWDDDAGRAARDYLSMRRVSREVADRAGLGFAPREPEAMHAHLSALGFADERLLEAGLLVQREEAGAIRPRFRNRLIFPIQDAAGHHVGFGGRLLGPGEPKYLNSSDSRIFSKGRLLYGLHWAKAHIRREDRVLVVEGYFDVVRLISAGLTTTVAPLGTALTEEQAKLVRRYTRNAYLLYDSDRAGLAATFRAGDELLRHGMAVQVVTLPDGEDPDSFVDKQGGDALKAHLSQAIDVFERKVQVLERGGWFADLRRTRRAIDRMLPTIRATADALTRDLYIARASAVAHVSKELLEREAAALGAAERAAPPSVARPGNAPAATRRDGDAAGRGRGAAPRRAGAARGAAAERELVRVLLHHRAQAENIADWRIGEDDFHDVWYRALFVALRNYGASASIEAVAGELPPEANAVMQELLEEPGAIVDVERTVEGSIAALRVRAMEQELAEIDRLLPLAADDAKDELITRKAQIRRDIQGLGGVGFRHYGKSHS